MICRRPGCCAEVAREGAYCSRRCTTIETRRKQTPAQRTRISLIARAAQRKDERERLLARVRCLADTEDARILAAYRIGQMADKSNRHRARRLKRYQQAMAARVA